MRHLVRLAILLLIAHALYRFVPVYVHHHQFKDAVAEVALFAKGRGDGEIADRVVRLAEQYQIPVAREAVQVTRDAHKTYINVQYEEQIEWLPSYKRRMPFAVSAEGWHTGTPSPTNPLR